MIYDDEISDEVLKALKPFDKLDLQDPIIVIGVNAVALKALVDVQNMHAGYDGDVFFDYDPNPFLRVTWWQTMTGAGNDLVFRFNPLRLEGDDTALYNAYDRAMGVL